MKSYEYSSEMHARFYEIRSALKKTQRAMAKALGYSGPYYSKLEKPDTYVGENVVLAMCSIFDVSYDYLVYGKGPMFVRHSAQEKKMLQLFNGLSEPFQDLLLSFVEAMSKSELNVHENSGED